MVQAIFGYYVSKKPESFKNLNIELQILLKSDIDVV